MLFTGRSKVLVLVGAGTLFSCGSDRASSRAATDSGTDDSSGGSGWSGGRAGRGGAPHGGSGGSSGGFSGTGVVGGVGGADSSASAGTAGTSMGDASRDAPGEAAWTCSGTCAALCTNILSQNCSDPTPFLHDRVACEAECSKPIPLIPADCDCSFKNYLECAAAAGIQCPRLRCNDAGICIDESMKVLGCEAENKAFDSCAGACLHKGDTNGGFSPGSDAGPSESYEYTSTGCECPPLETGLPPGSSCSDASDCAQFCCDCASDRGKFVGQLCLGGRCVGSAGGCDFGSVRTFGMCRRSTP